MRVGICRALLAHRYHDLWQGFVRGLGLEPVLSEPTNRRMLDFGLRHAPAETCLPFKAMVGHAFSLVGRVDCLLVPRYVCRRGRGRWLFGCPKYMALPDTLRPLLRGMVPVVELVIDEQRTSTEGAYRSLARSLGSQQRWRQALDSGQADYSAVRASGYPRARFCPEVPEPDGVFRQVRIGVVAHSYLIFDPLLSAGLFKRLAELGARIVLPELTDSSDGRSAASPVNWYFETELLGGVREMIATGEIDGLLLVSSFACGTSAVVHEIIRRDYLKIQPRLPHQSILLDEHTAEAGLLTRLESFVELIRMRR